MDIQQAAELLCAEAQAGRYFPEALRGRLTLAEALRVQLAVRDRKIAAGDRQAGWKVGLTSERVRQRYGMSARPFGHIMAADIYQSRSSIPMARFRFAAVEPELCFTIGTSIRGPGITPARARAAVAAVSAAFELNQNRAQGVADFPLNVADDLSQWGLVIGDTRSPLAPGLDLAAVTMECRCGAKVVARAVGDANTIDDHFLSLSILANTLAEYGEALEAGMRVITGSFSKHDVAAGEVWRASFSGIGEVSVRFD